MRGITGMERFIRDAYDDRYEHRPQFNGCGVGRDETLA